MTLLHYYTIALGETIVARATLTTKDGTRVVIEGSPEEVERLAGRLSGAGKAAKHAAPKNKSARSLPTATDAIVELKTEHFFKKPRALSDIKEKLASRGMIYPLTSLSGVVLLLVRKRALGRVKQDGRWLYIAR
jgi:hypothetical protein